MNIILCCVGSILIVLGLDYLIKEIIKAKLHGYKCVIFYYLKDENEIEYDLRRIMFSYPDNEIRVILNGKAQPEILTKLMKDYSNIKITDM